MNTDLLSWPMEFKQPSALQRCFQDVPIIGLNARAYNIICLQLRSRSRDCAKLWSADHRNSECLEIVLGIIRDVFCWPNDLFIPDDPCEIVFWSPQNDLKTAEAVMRVTKAFNLDDHFLDCLLDMSLGELILRINKIGR